MTPFLEKLKAYEKNGTIHQKLKGIIQDFYASYQKSVLGTPSPEISLQRFEQLIDLVIKNLITPPSFDIFHQAIRHPFDYYQFGIDFIRPFVDFSHSKIMGMESLKKIQEQLGRGENVILFANHQIEPDPQIISLLLEKIDPKLAVDMIFVAGHRVISDPLAVPMSLGRNLLCIYSKKYISNTPEEKGKKILHNQRTLNKMGELLNQGGVCIYVAPSGGRDRPNAQGEIQVAPFDQQSVELFWLMGKQSTSLTHFYPLALQTYHLMPPPIQVVKELGEKRTINVTPVFLSFGKELDMEHLPEEENLDKRKKREKRALWIWNEVRSLYEFLKEKATDSKKSIATQ